MHRKQFIKKMLQAGLCCCGVATGFGQNLLSNQKTLTSLDQSPAAQDWITKLERRMVKGSETPAWAKVEKAENWIKDLMDNMDAMLDKDTKIKLLQACGRSCFIRAFGVASDEKPTLEEAKNYLDTLKSRGYEVRQEDNMTTITYNWGRDHQNPWGLIIRDGYCMCPLVETGPADLSPTYCFCSTGYVKESFERGIGKPVKVNLLDSLKMGGKNCIFKIEVTSFP